MSKLKDLIAPLSLHRRQKVIICLYVAQGRQFCFGELFRYRNGASAPAALSANPVAPDRDAQLFEPAVSPHSLKHGMLSRCGHGIPDF
jgi:hypothetical protein